METGINIFSIYHYLSLRPDPVASRMIERQKVAKTDEEITDSLNEKAAYAQEMGTRKQEKMSFRTLHRYSEEEAKERLKELEKHLDHFREVASEEGRKIIVPKEYSSLFGEDLDENLARELGQTLPLKKLIRRYSKTSVDGGAKRILLEEIALRFFQKPPKI